MKDKIMILFGLLVIASGCIIIFAQGILKKEIQSPFDLMFSNAKNVSIVEVGRDTIIWEIRDGSELTFTDKSGRARVVRLDTKYINEYEKLVTSKMRSLYPDMEIRSTGYSLGIFDKEGKCQGRFAADKLEVLKYWSDLCDKELQLHMDYIQYEVNCLGEDGGTVYMPNDFKRYKPYQDWLLKRKEK